MNFLPVEFWRGFGLDGFLGVSANIDRLAVLMSFSSKFLWSSSTEDDPLTVMSKTTYSLLRRFFFFLFKINESACHTFFFFNHDILR